jgi:hypothetical protein
LLKEAEKSGHNEFYKLLERDESYRIGVGVELAPSGQYLIFIEIVVNLCSEPSEVNLSKLERNLLFLRDLEAKGYSMSCQEDAFIFCQKIVKPSDLNEEYATVKSMAPRTAK